MKTTLAELKTMPEFLALHKSHQVFVEQLMLNDYDAVRAAHLAYPQHSNPLILSAGLMSHWKIACALDRHFGRPLIDRVLNDLWMVIRQCQRRKGKISKAEAHALEIGIAFYEKMTGQPLKVSLRGLKNPAKKSTKK